MLFHYSHLSVMRCRSLTLPPCVRVEWLVPPCSLSIWSFLEGVTSPSPSELHGGDVIGSKQRFVSSYGWSICHTLWNNHPGLVVMLVLQWLAGVDFRCSSTLPVAVGLQGQKIWLEDRTAQELTSKLFLSDCFFCPSSAIPRLVHLLTGFAP